MFLTYFGKNLIFVLRISNKCNSFKFEISRNSDIGVLLNLKVDALLIGDMVSILV